LVVLRNAMGDRTIHGVFTMLFRDGESQ